MHLKKEYRKYQETHVIIHVQITDIDKDADALHTLPLFKILPKYLGCKQHHILLLTSFGATLCTVGLLGRISGFKYNLNS